MFVLNHVLYISSLQVLCSLFGLKVQFVNCAVIMCCI